MMRNLVCLASSSDRWNAVSPTSPRWSRSQHASRAVCFLSPTGSFSAAADDVEAFLEFSFASRSSRFFELWRSAAAVVYETILYTRSIELSSSEMTYIVSGAALKSTHSLHRTRGLSNAGFPNLVRYRQFLTMASIGESAGGDRPTPQRKWNRLLSQW